MPPKREREEVKVPEGSGGKKGGTRHLYLLFDGFELGGLPKFHHLMSTSVCVRLTYSAEPDWSYDTRFKSGGDPSFLYDLHMPIYISDPNSDAVITATLIEDHLVHAEDNIGSVSFKTGDVLAAMDSHNLAVIRGQFQADGKTLDFTATFHTELWDPAFTVTPCGEEKSIDQTQDWWTSLVVKAVQKQLDAATVLDPASLPLPPEPSDIKMTQVIGMNVAVAASDPHLPMPPGAGEILAVLNKLPFKDEPGHYPSRKIGRAWMAKHTQNLWPDPKEGLWQDVTTDDNFRQYCFCNAGAEFISRAADKTYFVDMDPYLAQWRTRAKWEPYGGKAFFDVAGKPTRIELSVDGKQETFTPGHEDWEYAKLRIRSGLFILASGMHLCKGHLRWANEPQIGTRRYLASIHPVNRLLAPHFFRAALVIAKSLSSLTPPRGMLHRSTAFEADSLAAFFQDRPGATALQRACGWDPDLSLLEVLQGLMPERTSDHQRWKQALEAEGLRTVHDLQRLPFARFRNLNISAYLKNALDPVRKFGACGPGLEELLRGVPQIDRAKLRVERKLASGSSGSVFGGVWRQANGKCRPVAIKRFMRSNGEKEFLREVQILKTAAHENVVRLLGVVMEEPLAIVLEFLPFTLASGKSKLDTPQKIRKAFSGFARGLARVHKLGCIHRDLKPANVLLDAELEARICDFGIGKIAGEDPGGPVLDGTFRYLAPECLNKGYKQDPSRDVYAFGLILRGFLEGQQPFEGETFEQMMVSKFHLPELDTDSFADSTSRSLAELANRCTELDPALRPDSQHVAFVLSGLQGDVTMYWPPRPPTARGATLYAATGDKVSAVLSLMQANTNPKARVPQYCLQRLLLTDCRLGFVVKRHWEPGEESAHDFTRTCFGSNGISLFMSRGLISNIELVNPRTVRIETLDTNVVQLLFQTEDVLLVASFVALLREYGGVGRALSGHESCSPSVTPLPDSSRDVPSILMDILRAVVVCSSSVLACEARKSSITKLDVASSKDRYTSCWAQSARAVRGICNSRRGCMKSGYVGGAQRAVRG